MLGLTVRDFLDLAIDSFDVDIFDCAAGEVVYSGNSNDVPYEYAYLEVESFDPPSMSDYRLVFTINVSIEEE
jgi:hypothetical protein